MTGGVVESVDGGQGWRSLGGPAGAMWVSWDAATPTHLIAAGPEAAGASTDGGRTWGEIRVPEGASIVEVSPSDPKVMYAAIHNGRSGRVRVEASHDGGATWTTP